MKVLMVKSIPLAEDTQAAWRASEDYEVKFLGRKRDIATTLNVAERYNYDLVINLGNSGLKAVDNRTPMVNSGEIVEFLKDSVTLRQTVLGGYMPPQPLRGDGAWRKGGGHGGKNKEYIAAYDPDANYANGDLQRHIEGREYRVITVGDKIVQVQRRTDNEPFNPAVRQYEWIGVRAAPKPVKKFVKHLLDLIPYDGLYLIGWDIIVADKAIFLLEGNTCPGVNEATAGRILKQIHYELFEVEKVEDVDEVDEPAFEQGPAERAVRQLDELWNGLQDFAGNHPVDVAIDAIEQNAVQALDDFNQANEQVQVNVEVGDFRDFRLDLERIQEKLEKKIVDQLYRNLIGDLEIAVKAVNN